MLAVYNRSAGTQPNIGTEILVPITSAIESLSRVIRKSIKTRGSFPTEDAATKLIYLAIRSFENGGRNVRERIAARNQLAIMFEDRSPA
ncbi:hypothetical protein SAMN04488020_1252 [Palleronia marisminoris]|uniref:Transposase, Mutator family n=1 Tax=Palleronia marisminoris TaxID=315423 RepID=A0A1Y5TTU3_9RHOB|nr:hypothetical protein SAMN04488020_1252 [Palleronia marisminoris]SLN71478.1 hypothetical protein PAM7066_03666 [Palleronia marisminoris]